MDISEYIMLHAEQLIKDSNKLKEITIHWEIPIIIECSNLKSKDTFIKQTHNPELQYGKSKPGIYYFKIDNEIGGIEVVSSLEHYKEKKERSCPKIDRSKSMDSTYLYCGSVKKNLLDRLIQHLGFRHKDTYSLQLVHWAKNLGLKLEYHYAFMRAEEKHLIRHVEASLFKALNPLVGKRV